jgi:hypothetical protein
VNQESRKRGKTYLEARNPGIKETVSSSPNFFSFPGFLVSNSDFFFAD